MSLTINIYYTGKDGAARKFAEEMVEIRQPQSHWL